MLKNRKRIYVSIIVVFLSFFIGSSFCAYAWKADAPSDWALFEVQEAIDSNLVTESVLSNFSEPITREEFCELAIKLYEKVKGEEAIELLENPFNDTTNKEILKAYKLEIVEGYGDGRFGPNDLITREQIAVMFYRTLKAARDDASFISGDMSFVDKLLISDWAQEEVKYMSWQGLIKGMGDNTFSPKTNATREQAIALVRRVYIQYKGYLGRTTEELSNKWAILKPLYEGDPYVVKPSAEFPYSTGEVNEQLIEDALNMVNYTRYIAGVPDDLYIDWEKVNEAQYGAILLGASTFSHEPPKPTDMDQDFYDIGFSVTSSSNIFSLWSYQHENSYARYLTYSIMSYLEDSGSNTDKLGHRRWILNPAMTKTAFGFADTLSNDGTLSIRKYYCTMYAFDMSRSEKAEYNYVAWPSPGKFPTMYFEYNGKEKVYPWSVSLNPDLYQEPQEDEVKINVTNLNDGQNWEIDKNDIQETLNTETEYFTINKSSFGIPNCIIFSLPDNIQYSPRDRYFVEITGIRNTLGKLSSISYVVEFVSITS